MPIAVKVLLGIFICERSVGYGRKEKFGIRNENKDRRKEKDKGRELLEKKGRKESGVRYEGSKEGKDGRKVKDKGKKLPLTFV